MALEFICSNEIVPFKKIKIPREDGANSYGLQSGKIKFFYVNPCIGEKMKELPLKATEVSFDSFKRNSYNIYYGELTFYDKEGNILKSCNGIRLWTNQ